MEIKITPDAMEALKEKLKKNGSDKAIRVYLAGVGCGGGGIASYSISLDEPKAGDNVYELDGLKIIYDNLVPQHANSFHIEYRPSSFEEEQFKIEGKYIRKTL